jgi:hypothetical protein
MKWFQPTAEQLVAWDAWLADRPEHVRAIAERFNPWTLYRLTTTGQRCSVIGFHETSGPIAVTAYIRAENPVLGELSARNVFGIDPDTLVPWTDADEVHAPLPSTFGDERWP